MADSMKKLEFYLNVVHYCIYRLDSNIAMFISKNNPVRYIVNMPFFQRRMKKQVDAYNEELKKNLYIYIDKYIGISIGRAGGY